VRRLGKAPCGRCQLDNRVESLIVVDAGPLGEATKNPASLVPFQCTVGVELVLEDSLAGDDVGANRTRDNIPCAVGDQSSIFFLHGTTPGRVDKGGTGRGGHRRE
jgi:hypothetical protein